MTKKQQDRLANSSKLPVNAETVAALQGLLRERNAELDSANKRGTEYHGRMRAEEEAKRRAEAEAANAKLEERRAREEANELRKRYDKVVDALCSVVSGNGGPHAVYVPFGIGR